MIIIQGKGASAGIGSGPLYFYRRPEVTIRNRIADQPEPEWGRFIAARKKAVEQLEILSDKVRREAGDDAALLFETHRLMAEDPDYEEAISHYIFTERLNAEAAVLSTSAQFEEMFAAMPDAYMQARAADIKDLSDRLVRLLTGVVSEEIESPVPVLLAADDLAPSETVRMDKSKIRGFITSGGSRLGHTAILAKTLGIPAVIGAKEILCEEYEGHEAIIDGLTGEIVIDPDDATKKELHEKKESLKRLQVLRESLKGEPNITRDGKSVRICCNIGSPQDIPLVWENDGGGIGLFRSEFLYLNSTAFPTEEQQFAAYRHALSEMKGKEVIIRTMDMGADKNVGYFNLPQEQNPALGMRALRICLEKPELFRTQLRALYRASVYGRLSIMFPMVTSVWEVKEAKRFCYDIKQELTQSGIPFSEDIPLGIMIETPAAAMISDRLAREADFFSIGTNDLTQYTLACDRMNDSLERFYNPHHPAVLRLIRMVAQNAHKNGIWVGVCGELAGDTALTETFVALGVDELSVSPQSVLLVREAVRAADTSTSTAKWLEDPDS